MPWTYPHKRKRAASPQPKRKVVGHAASEWDGFAPTGTTPKRRPLKAKVVGNWSAAGPGPISPDEDKLRNMLKKSGRRLKRAPKYEGAELTPYQQKMVAKARPKAKAQRSAAEIAAMQAFRARRPKATAKKRVSRKTDRVKRQGNIGY